MCAVSTVVCSYPLSVQLASDLKLSSDRVDGEGAALVPLHDGEAHVVVRGAVQILRHHLRHNRSRH